MSPQNRKKKGNFRKSKIHNIASIIKMIYEITEIVKTIVNFFHE